MNDFNTIDGQISAIFDQYEAYLSDVPNRDREAVACMIHNTLQKDATSFWSKEQMIWLIKESWNRLLYKSMVSVQPMLGPTFLQFHTEVDHADNSCNIRIKSALAMIYRYDFCIFPTVEFDHIKDAYAQDIASSLDRYIVKEMLPRIDYELLMDSDDKDTLNLVAGLDYVIGPESLIKKLARVGFDGDTYIIGELFCPDTFKIIARAGLYPGIKAELPIFSPYMLLVKGLSEPKVYDNIGASIPVACRFSFIRDSRSTSELQAMGRTSLP